MDAMARFLSTTGHGSTGNQINAENLKRTILKLSYLIAGAGIRYPHWGNDEDGNDNCLSSIHVSSITLQTDTLTLLEDAKMWEAEYGKDLGNGWLMNHPITKLACYQVHLSQEDDVLSEMDLRIKKTYTKLE
tara:strand:- start:25 stop:420 length:396 start_codon:yes stop_codon:yes gene_type:complete